MDDLESSVNQQLTERPVTFHLPLAGNGVVNVMITRGTCWCLPGFQIFCAPCYIRDGAKGIEIVVGKQDSMSSD